MSEALDNAFLTIEPYWIFSTGCKWVAAPVMHTRLIQPLASDTAGGEPWGVAAVGAEASRFDGTDVVIALLDTVSMQIILP